MDTGSKCEIETLKSKLPMVGGAAMEVKQKHGPVTLHVLVGENICITVDEIEGLYSIL